MNSGGRALTAHKPAVFWVPTHLDGRGRLWAEGALRRSWPVVILNTSAASFLGPPLDATNRGSDSAHPVATGDGERSFAPSPREAFYRVRGR